MLSSDYINILRETFTDCFTEDDGKYSVFIKSTEELCREISSDADAISILSDFYERYGAVQYSALYGRKYCAEEYNKELERLSRYPSFIADSFEKGYMNMRESMHSQWESKMSESLKSTKFRYFFLLCAVCVMAVTLLLGAVYMTVLPALVGIPLFIYLFHQFAIRKSRKELIDNGYRQNPHTCFHGRKEFIE